MSKPVYKVMDSKGRVLIPRELRLAAGMCGGDILALQLREGKVSVRKVEIIFGIVFPLLPIVLKTAASLLWRNG